MSEKRTVKIIIYKDWLPMAAMPFNQIVEFVRDKQLEIPGVYRPGAKWSMSPPCNGKFKVIISYKRFETDEENAVRDAEDAEKATKANQKRVEEARLVAEKYSDILDVKPEFRYDDSDPVDGR